MFLNRFYFAFIGITIILMSCTSNTIYKKPDDLIPKNKMIELMTDIYIANAATNVHNIHEERQKNYMYLVYKKYGIDSAQFAGSNQYYISKIDEYKKMHEKVQKRISKLKKEKEAALNPPVKEKQP
jgi:hypothetical protein